MSDLVVEITDVAADRCFIGTVGVEATLAGDYFTVNGFAIEQLRYR